jgi:ribonuclease Z
MLDAGPQNFNHPQFILITHSHGDHIALLPFTLIEFPTSGGERRPVEIYGPSKAKPFIENYIDTLFTTNAMIPPSPREELDTFYRYYGKNVMDTFDIKVKNAELSIEVFSCDHGIPTISYGISEKKMKLNPEYANLSGKEIVALRNQNVDVTILVTTKRFAYVCDTTIKAFDINSTIIEYPVIFIECTFLFDDEIEMASGKKHIHFNELKPYIENNPDIEFMLFHFSQRYKDAEISEFLEKQDLKNMHWWA